MNERMTSRLVAGHKFPEFIDTYTITYILDFEDYRYKCTLSDGVTSVSSYLNMEIIERCDTKRMSNFQNDLVKRFIDKAKVAYIADGGLNNLKLYKFANQLEAIAANIECGTFACEDCPMYNYEFARCKKGLII